MDLTELHASKTVAFNVRERRVTLGWSRRELAERSGLAEQALTDIELMRRQRGVTVDELMLLACALSVDPDKLLPPVWHYISDPHRKAAAEMVLADAMVKLATARQKQENMTSEFGEVAREINQLQGIIESVRQGRF